MKNDISISKNDILSGSLSFIKKILVSDNFILYLCICYFLIFVPFYPQLVSSYTMSNILSNIWPFFTICLGQATVLIVAGIDLSQISVVNLTGMLGAMIMAENLNPDVLKGAPIWGTFISESGGLLQGSVFAIPAAILVMLIAGALIGFLNGFSIVKFKMPPFMVTLVTQMLFGAVALFLTKSENINNLPKAFTGIGGGSLWILPNSLFIAGALAVGAHIMLSKTMLGRWTYSTGTNIKASMVSGIPTGKVTILAYVFSGFCASVAAILYTSRSGYSSPTYFGETFLMDIIAAVVIGGVSLFGGKGKVKGIVFGAVFIILLQTTLNFMNTVFGIEIDTFVQEMIKGLVILVAAYFDVTRTKLLAAQS